MTEHWPLFDLVVRTEHLELRLPTDPELNALADLALLGVHAPEAMPFLVPWTRRPSPDLEQGLLQYHWSQRATWQREAWNLELGVFHLGEPIGCQAVGASRFEVTRTVSTGSWLGLAHQGRGFGTEMRLAVLALAFDHLGAVRAESGAHVENAASLGVSRSLGYEPDGQRINVVEGRRRVERRVTIELEGWRSRPRPAVGVEGLERCRELFGVPQG